MKTLIIAALLIITGCSQHTQQVTMRVDTYTQLKMTDEEAHYETKLIDPNTGDTINVEMAPTTYNLYSKKNRPTLVLIPR